MALVSFTPQEKHRHFVVGIGSKVYDHVSLSELRTEPEYEDS
jgi:hypothetical protein